MVNKLLQNNDLTYVRNEAIKSLPDTVDIQRKTLVGDGQGGYSETWSSAYQNIAARLIASGGGESNAAGRQDLQAGFTLTLAHDQSVEQTDRILHTSGTYEVQTIDTGKSWSITTRCQIRRL